MKLIYESTIYIFFLGIICVMPFCDANSFSILESEHVHFDEDLMVFEGPLVLESEQGKIQAKKATLKVTNTKGKFQFHHAILENDVTIAVGDQFTVRCKNAIYKDDQLTLYKDIEVDFDERGVLRVSDELQLKRNSAGVIDTVRCIGTCEYRCEDEEKDIDLMLFCHGEIFLDNQSGNIYLKGENNGEGRQLYLRDHLGKIFSDQAIVNYVFENGSFSLKTISLNENVRLLNRSGSISQYALADHMTYEHESQQMHFKSDERKRVLFYDKINNLQVSAPEIKMQRDKQTKKEHFQGIGDVRFHFAEKEYQQLRNCFLLEKKEL